MGYVYVLPLDRLRIPLLNPAHFLPNLRQNQHCNENPIPRKGIAQAQSQFPQSCVCERYIYTVFPWSVNIFSCSRIGRPIMGIYKSLTDTECGNWAEAAQLLFWEFLFRIFGNVSLQWVLALESVFLWFYCSVSVTVSKYAYCIPQWNKTHSWKYTLIVPHRTKYLYNMLMSIPPVFSNLFRIKCFICIVPFTKFNNHACCSFE